MLTKNNCFFLFLGMLLISVGVTPIYNQTESDRFIQATHSGLFSIETGDSIELSGISQQNQLNSSRLVDNDKDGFPDSAELIDEADRVRFRRWFTAIAESQFYAIHSGWPQIRWDCTGLICFAYKEALKTHNEQWFKEFKYLSNPAVPDIKGFHYPNIPIIGSALFRTRSGPLGEADLDTGAFEPVATAQVLMDFNCRYLGNQLDEGILEGDILFFRYFSGQRMVFHTMILIKNYCERNPGKPEGIVVYHTGPDGESVGEVRKCLISTLNHHPDDIWHVKPNNPFFMGFYRFNILDYDLSGNK